MKRFLLGAYLAVFAIAISGVATVPGRAQAQTVTGITGDWVVQATGEKLMAGTLHLTRVGDTVIGSTEAGGGILQVNGTLKGDVLSAKWRGPKNNVGWLTFTFNTAGTSFHGNWGYGGRKPSGSVVGRQLASTAF